MTLNASGPISLAGATTGQSIAVELGVGTTTQISLNCTNVRTLAGVPTGAIVMPTNFWGKSNVPFGCATYGTAGSYSFVVPSGVSKICVVCIGGGGNGYGVGSTNSGGGGALSYTNCIPVTAGETLSVVVAAGATSGGNGGTSSVSRGATVLISAQGGYVNSTGPQYAGLGGKPANGVGAVKYKGGDYDGSGGGAAGYAGDGGQWVCWTSGIYQGATGGLPSAGSGAAAAGIIQVGFTAHGGGGGVGLYGIGATASSAGCGGSGGSAGEKPTTDKQGGYGGAYGGGGGGPDCDDAEDFPGGPGAKGGVRIIYGGTGKSYPSNAT